MGAVFLAELDARLAGRGFRVVRYMDDILVLAPTRWKLRKAACDRQPGIDGVGTDEASRKNLHWQDRKGI